MQYVSAKDLISAVPVYMTKKEKLQRWAEIVRQCKNDLYLFHGLEYLNPRQLRSVYPQSIGMESAFTLAEKDTTFQAQGLKVGSSLADHMEFFSLTQQELHEFSCNCGGQIDNQRMASRIQALG
jgi:hypothetical protein